MAKQLRDRTWIATSIYKGHPCLHPFLTSLVLPHSLQGAEVVRKRENPFPITLLPCPIGQYRKKRMGSLANGLTHHCRPLCRWSSGSLAGKQPSIS